MTSLPTPAPPAQLGSKSVDHYISFLLVPEAVCLAIQSTVFGLVVGVGMSYYRRNRDGWKLRSFVSLQLALNISILTISWRQFVTNLENVVANSLGSADTTSFGSADIGLLKAAIILAGFNIMLSQYFLGYHVVALNKKWTGITCSFFVFNFAAVGFSLSVWVIVASDFIGPINVVVFHISQEVFIVMADLIATVFFFRHYKGIRHNFADNLDVLSSSRTSRLMKKVMIFVINRGVLVTCAQFAFLGPSTLGFVPWIPLNASLANVYVLTTLMILDTRSSIHGSLKRPSPATVTTNLQSEMAVG